MVLGEVLQLHAKAAARHRVIRVSGHLDQFFVLDVVQKSTSVGAVLRAGTTNDTGGTRMGRHTILLLALTTDRR
jgi:hypothetical protein